MRSLKYIAILCIFGLCVACSQKIQQEKMTKPKPLYIEFWTKIDSLEQKGQLKVALDSIQSKLLEFEKSENEDQILKAKFYEAKYQVRLSENSYEQTINTFESKLAELNNNKFERIYNSILGELYEKYAKLNQFKIAQRTQTLSDTEDITTWSLQKLLLKSNAHYYSSVDTLVNKKDAQEINNILDNPKKRPEQFDLNTLLLIRAIKHFSNEYTLAIESTNGFTLRADEAFATKEIFSNFNFETSAVSVNNPQLRTLRLYQKLLRYQTTDLLSDKINNDRLQYVYRISQSENKDELYKNRLVESSNTSDYAKYQLAKYLFDISTLHNYSYGAQKSENSINLNEVRNLLIDVKQSYKDSSLVYNAFDLLTQLESTSFDLKMEEVLLPSQQSLFSLNYKNIEYLELSIKSISKSELNKYKQTRNREDQLKIINSLSDLKSWKIDLPNSEFKQLSTESKLPQLPLGRYILVSKHLDQTTANFFQVSNLAAHTLSTPNGNYLQAFNRETGEPYSNVSIEIIEERFNRNRYEEIVVQTITSNSKGEANYTITDRQRTKLRLSKGEDVYETSSQHTYPQTRKNSQNAVHIFTDRNLYRQGSQLQGKAIAVTFDSKTKSNRILPNEQLNLIVRDPNYQEIHSHELVTNQFGSVAFNFNISDDRLAGTYSIELKNKSNELRGSQRFQVEEYKRPSFTTKIKLPTKPFSLGDTIQVETHSELFSGASLSNAVIEYRVTRSLNRYSYRFPIQPASINAEIINGKVTTDKSGNAVFNLPLKAPLNEGANYNFEIQLTVVDNTGETQFASKSFNVNQTSFSIDLNIPNVISNEQLKNTSIYARNSTGEKVKTEVAISVFQLETPLLWRKNKYWNSMDTMLLSNEDYAEMPYEYMFNDKDLNTWKERGKSFDKKILVDIDSKLILPTLDPGFYILKIASDDKLVTERKFQIINFQNNINPSQDLISYRLNKAEYEIGDELIVDISIPQKEVQIQYLIEKEGRIVSNKWLKPGDQIKTNILKSDEGGFIIHLRSVFRNRIEYKKIIVEVPFKNSKLIYTIDRYKSTLKPGEEVSWQVNFKGNKNKNRITESVWSMYDSSLDALFTDHEWKPFYLAKYSTRFFPTHPTFRIENSKILQYPSNNRPNIRRPDDSYPNINTYGFRMMDMSRLHKSTSRTGSPVAEASMGGAANEISEFSDKEAVQVETNNNQEAQELQPIRKNFNETVFFYPDIKSDNSGNATVSFKMSDAMTSWKVLLFAHDKQGSFVYDTLQLKTSLDVFIIANKPRFTRLNDKLWMTTKLVNNTTKDINATTWIEFFDIKTGLDISDKITNGQKEKQVTLSAASSISVDWEMAFPADMESRSIGFRIGVKHNNGSDVIEDFIQVLDNKQLVRQSQALFLKAGETINYNLDSLGSGQNSNLSLELVADTDWQVIKALPYLDDQSMETCSNYLYQFAANSIGRFIVNNNEYVKNQLSQVQVEEIERNSQLSIKDEFKTINLKKTPWVRNGEDESSQQEAMLKFLNSEQVAVDLKKSLDKLLSFQQSDGGFSWLNNRKSNLFISSSVLHVIGRLHEKGIPHDFPKERINNLIQFIDIEIHEQLNKNPLRDYQIDLFSFIQSRSYFHDVYPLDRKLINKFTSEYSKGWVDYSASTQAIIGLIANRLNMTELSRLILSSIKQQTIESKSLGTYWKTNRNYFSNQSSIDRHVNVMEFLQRLDSKSTVLEGAKIWLLNNKRTNAWNSKPSTSSAIFAFLNNNTGTTKSSSIEDVTLMLNEKQLNLSDELVLNGTQTIIPLNAEKINSSSNLRMTNNNKGPVWASIYKSYRKPITEIESFTSDAIKIEKSIFIKRLTENGPLLSPINSQELQSGDRLTVKLTINNDRALQFVHVEDKRASGLEPKDVISKYAYTDALFYYQVTSDESTHFLISNLPRGTHVLEYDLTVNLRGEYSSGFSSIQCQYAPEFGAHSESINLDIPK